MNNKDYFYKIGDIVNGSLKIVKCTRKEGRKSYEVSSTKYPTAPTYIVSEINLKRGMKDSYVYGLKVCEENSLWSIKELRHYISDIDTAKEIRPKSHKEIKVKCPECLRERHIKAYSLVDKGMICQFCSSKTSYPERFMMSYLEIKNIDYEFQKKFEKLDNRIFDFYIEGIGVIETHGEQHYKDYFKTSSSWKNTFKKTQISDKEKENFCRKTNITYISIDCMKSEFEYIKESINSCPYLENIEKEEEKILINKISDKKNYPVNRIKKLYEETGSTEKVGEILNISRGTIVNILKRNNIKLKNKNKKNIKSVRCVTTDKKFNSLKEASKYYNMNSSTGISECCKGKRKTAGKHPESLEPLEWEYVNV